MIPEIFENGREYNGNELVAIRRIGCQRNVRINQRRLESIEKHSVFIIFECSHNAILKCAWLDSSLQVLPFSKSADEKMCRFHVKGAHP